jgi:hypothetical protein
MALELKTGYLHYQRYLSQIKEIYKKREDIKVYSGLILSLLTISFFGFFAIKPTLSTIASLVKEIKDKREVNQKLQEKINALTLAQGELLQVSDDLYLLDEALTPKPNLALFINQLEVLAKKNNLKINSLSFSSVIFYEQKKETLKSKEGAQEEEIIGEINPKEKPQEKEKKSPETKQDYRENNFSFQSSGTLADLKKLLENLENFRRIVKTEKVSLTQEKDQNWTLALNGKIFYQKQ